MARSIVLMLVAAFLAASGSLWAWASDPQDKDKKDEKVITTKSGLKYVELKEGTGDEAKAGQTVEVGAEDGEAVLGRDLAHAVDVGGSGRRGGGGEGRGGGNEEGGRGGQQQSEALHDEISFGCGQNGLSPVRRRDRGPAAHRLSVCWCGWLLDRLVEGGGRDRAAPADGRARVIR